MLHIDDVVIATPTLEDHIERLEEVFSCSDGCLQQHGAFHHGNKSAHDANGSRKSASVDVFLP